MSSLDASSLYNVDGLVALITGGGTGKHLAPKDYMDVHLYVAALRLHTNNPKASG